ESAGAELGEAAGGGADQGAAKGGGRIIAAVGQKPAAQRHLGRRGSGQGPDRGIVVIEVEDAAAAEPERAVCSQIVTAQAQGIGAGVADVMEGRAAAVEGLQNGGAAEGDGAVVRREDAAALQPVAGVRNGGA